MAEKLLDKINYPSDLRKLKKSQLEQVSSELRKELIDVVSETGGHLGAGLGVVELTVALHYVFNTPNDKLVWDVGHQCYPHKIITGRKERIKTLRKGGGLSGFTKRSESEYDPFGAAHSSTSISSTLGMATAKKLSNDKNIPVFIDPKGSDWEKYKNADLITPNTGETEVALGQKLESDEDFEMAGKKICSTFNIKACLITRGSDGMSLIRQKNIIHLKSEAKEIFDVSGAGDTVIAAMATGLLTGSDYKKVLEFSNVAAGIVVGHV